MYFYVWVIAGCHKSTLKCNSKRNCCFLLNFVNDQMRILSAITIRYRYHCHTVKIPILVSSQRVTVSGPSDSIYPAL